MSWILPSLLMYLFSVILYLATRAAQKQGIAKEVYSLWMFGLPALSLILIESYRPSSYNIGIFNWLLLIISAIFFSWLGNLFSQLSILTAPNPGYPLIISKSYVVYTAIASIWLFNSNLTLKSVIGIILIILFSALITFASDVKNQSVTSLKWLWYSLGAFFCWGSLALASKYALSHGVTITLRLLVIHIIVTLILYTETKINHLSLKTPLRQLPLLFVLGVSGGLFNYFMQAGFQAAPNPGFVNATNAASISAVTLLSALIFKDNLNSKKFLGVLGVTLGLIILMI